MCHIVTRYQPYVSLRVSPLAGGQPGHAFCRPQPLPVSRSESLLILLRALPVLMSPPVSLVLPVLPVFSSSPVSSLALLSPSQSPCHPSIPPSRTSSPSPPHHLLSRSPVPFNPLVTSPSVSTVHKCVSACQGVPKCVEVCVSERRCVWVCLGVSRCARAVPASPARLHSWGSA